MIFRKQRKINLIAVGRKLTRHEEKPTGTQIWRGVTELCQI
jgi:hypothetical protein